jgi:hypothetical protein
MPKRDSLVLYYIDIGTTFLGGHIFRNALGGKLRHAVELALGATWTPSYTHWVVEDGAFCIVRICLVARFGLTEA